MVLSENLKKNNILVKVKSKNRSVVTALREIEDGTVRFMTEEDAKRVQELKLQRESAMAAVSMDTNNGGDKSFLETDFNDSILDIEGLEGADLLFSSLGDDAAAFGEDDEEVAANGNGNGHVEAPAEEESEEEE